MSVLRICLIANPNSIHTQRWVQYFAGRGHDVHLIGEKPIAAAPPPGCHFHDLTLHTNQRKVRYLVWAQAVRRLVRVIQPDVLHAHQVASAGWLGAAAGYHPFLATSWGSDLLLGTRRSRAQRVLARWVLRQADRITCVSQNLAEATVALGAPPLRVEVVPWGVDLDLFHPAETDHTPGETPLVLSIRAMRALYNPQVIARAIPAVLARVPQARFVIRTYNSDQGLLAQVQQQIADSGAGYAVSYVGDLPGDAAIADLYRRAAVAISVPSSDGTPQSVLEAMACGVVPVLSDLPSLREWVADGREALLVPAGDSEALGQAIVRLLDDRALVHSLRSAGLARSRERADSRRWMQRNEDIYRELAAAHRPQSVDDGG